MQLPRQWWNATTLLRRAIEKKVPFKELNNIDYGRNILITLRKFIRLGIAMGRGSPKEFPRFQGLYGFNAPVKILLSLFIYLFFSSF
jgi:hypothetical protein